MGSGGLKRRCAGFASYGSDEVACWSTNRDLPSILFVQVDNGAITHTLTVKLKARMVESLFVEVQDIIETAATSLKQECIDRLKGTKILPSGQSNSPSLDTSSNAMPSAGS